MPLILTLVNSAAIEAIGALAALGLAAVLALAGAMKLADPSTTGREFRALGLPAARPLAVVVPLVELAVASTLILRPVVGGVLAAALVLAFSAVVATRLGWNRRHDRAAFDPVVCSCFGGLSRRPFGLHTLVRNLGLLALAALATLSPGLGRLDLRTAIAVGATVAAVGVLIALGLQLIRLKRITGRLWSLAPIEGPASRFPVDDAFNVEERNGKDRQS